MKQNDISSILRRDDSLREAVARRERKQPPMPEGLNERALQRIAGSAGVSPAKEHRHSRRLSCGKNAAPPMRRLWWAAAAACLLLIIGIGILQTPPPTPPRKGRVQRGVAARSDSRQGVSTSIEAVAEPKHGLSTSIEAVADLREGVSPPYSSSQPRGKDSQTRHSLPDTLGNGIWQHEENVVRAVRILSECEADIRQEEQEIRNHIIRATFRAMPQPAGVILVSDENGDYEVIETKRIINI